MYEKGLMTGVDAETFAPALNLTRDQFAVILWRAEGSPKMDYEEKFADVAEGQWYTDAVLWANENGIATGYADTGLPVGTHLLFRRIRTESEGIGYFRQSPCIIYYRCTIIRSGW